MSLSLLAVPVMLDTAPDSLHLLRQWARMYYYGQRSMPRLAIATSLLYGYALFRRRNETEAAGRRTTTTGRKAKEPANPGRPWAGLAMAAGLTLAIIPYTLLVMAPTNNRLFALEELGRADTNAASLADAKELVIRWRWLHMIRSSMPLIGAVIGAVVTY